MFKIIFYYSFECNTSIGFKSVEVTYDDEMDEEKYKNLQTEAIHKAEKEYPTKVIRITGTSPILKVNAK